VCVCVCVCVGFFQDRVARNICLGWLQTTILLISASWVAGITGVSHQQPATAFFFFSLFFFWIPEGFTEPT
jgi:hypothetical protein